MKKLIRFFGSATTRTIDEVVKYLMEAGVDVITCTVTEFKEIEVINTPFGRINNFLIPSLGFIIVSYEGDALDPVFEKAKQLAGN